MDKIKIPVSSELASALAKVNKSAIPIASIAKKLNSELMPAYKFFMKQQNFFHSIQTTFAQPGLSAKSIYSAMSQYQNSLLSATSESAKIASIASQSGIFKHAKTLTDNWKTNLTCNLGDLSHIDFRIGVVSQELEQVVADKPKEVTDKLLFKEIPEPTDTIESKLFEILKEQREILDNNTKILNEMNKSQTENVYDEESKKVHSSPTSYQNKEWYAEEIESQLIGIIITSIFAITIGVDPTNTLVFALLVRYLLNFLK